MTTLRQAVDAVHIVSRARVTQEFLAVPQGRVIGQRFRVGDAVYDGIAAIAVNEGWAVEIREPARETK